MKNLSAAKLIELHERIIKNTGGEPGVLFLGTLEYIEHFLESESILDTDIMKTAAKILIAIIQGHPFVDGNKRTGFEATDIFLVRNGYYINCTPDEGVDFALSIARNELKEDKIEEWLNKHTKRIK